MTSSQIPRHFLDSRPPLNDTFPQKPLGDQSCYEQHEPEDASLGARDRHAAPPSINGELQHYCCLLASIMLPAKADLHSHQLIDVEAYICHVDTSNMITFKLTTKSIEALTQYHKEIRYVDAEGATDKWEKQCNKLHEAFVAAVNAFNYCTHVSALELDDGDRTGELLDGKSYEVKTQLINLMETFTMAEYPPSDAIIEGPGHGF